MDNRFFHQVRMAGIAFEGILSTDGPYLSSRMHGGVALGLAGLRYFQPVCRGIRRVPPRGWWVVKYCDEERIVLPGFDSAATRKLSNEFGVPTLAELSLAFSDHVRREHFFTSPAWDALRRWVTKHPRIAKTFAACTPYLLHWYDRAIVEGKALAL